MSLYLIKTRLNFTSSLLDQNNPKSIFLLGALRLVNAASPRTISLDKKKISSGTQGNFEDIILVFFFRQHMSLFRKNKFVHEKNAPSKVDWWLRP